MKCWCVAIIVAESWRSDARKVPETVGALLLDSSAGGAIICSRGLSEVVSIFAVSGCSLPRFFSSQLYAVYWTSSA